MIVICEECGKKYRVDPAKIKGQSAKFRCKACDHILVVNKPNESLIENDAPPDVEKNETDEEYSSTRVSPDDFPPNRTSQADTAVSRSSVESRQLRSRHIGLRSKMILLFFFLPIMCFSAAGYLFLQKMNYMASTLTTQSSEIVTAMAEQKLTDISRAVATQCRLYLFSHPGMIRDNFNNHSDFKSLVVQKVGLTGYTALYERPLRGDTWRTWAHPNEKIIGIDMRSLKREMKGRFDGFWKVYTGVKEGKESTGYYTWREKDGSFRKKYMACTPIEGTPYVIAATTYIDELIQPVLALEQRSAEIVKQTQTTIVAIFAGTLVLIGLIVSIYGHRLTGRIRKLTTVADRISIGELEAEIKVQSNDEIGELANAIARMQDSIRLSIERLRRRR